MGWGGYRVIDLTNRKASRLYDSPQGEDLGCPDCPLTLPEALDLWGKVKERSWRRKSKKKPP